ncbi:MAG: transglutaminase domain-containing protein [Desulfovibrionaceae bacterium]|nr:transglutaminase domain-containing protein [Desulfovibrionaceae bacterium]
MRNAFLFLTLFAFLFFSVQEAYTAEKKSGTVTFSVDLKTKPDAKTALVYLPYPLSDNYQDITDMQVSGNFSEQGVYRDPKSGSFYLKASWKSLSEKPSLTMRFHVDSKYTKGKALPDGDSVIPVDVRSKLLANDYLPVTHPEVVRCAKEATANAKTMRDKAYGVYLWTIDHTFRDPDVRGCGLGEAIKTLTEAHGGGKCADISSVFITVARAAGIPARDVYGLRIKGTNGAITGDFHCWAEFYLPGHGWVMADPADVRKAMLVEKLAEKSPKAQEYTKFFWNGDNLFRIALNRGEHGVAFPGMKGEPVGYFMYPYAEVDGKALDYFAPSDFAFSVHFTAD